MTNQEALGIVSQATAKLNADRDTHMAIIAALQVINETINSSVTTQAAEQAEATEKRKVAPFKKITEPAK